MAALERAFGAQKLF